MMARSTVAPEELELMPPRKMRARARSYKVAVKTITSDEWAYNELRFPSRGAGERYALDLQKSWLIVTGIDVQESDDPSNANYPVPSERYDVPRGV